MRSLVGPSLLALALSSSCAARPPKGAAPSPAPLAACANPLPLTPGTSVRSSTRLGANRLRASCLRADAPECAFSLEVSQRSELRLSLESSDFDGALALYVDGETPTELRCVDDVPSGDLHHARIDATVAPGRYLVVVDGASGETGDFELFSELEPLPSIDAVCAAAKPLPDGVTVRDSTRGGVNLFNATCGGGAQGPEHVRKLSLSEPSRVRIRQRADYDGSLYVRAACEDASSEVACNDDYQTSGNSLLAARLGAGDYFVFSDSYSRDHTGDYSLAVERFADPGVVAPAAACANVAKSAPLSSGAMEVDTFYGSNAHAGSCGGDGAPEVAIPLRVESPTTLIAVLEDAELNAVLYLRKDCADADSEIACYVAPRIDRAGGEADSSPPALIAPLERGSYTLIIDGAEASDLGAATLRALLTASKAR